MQSSRGEREGGGCANTHGRRVLTCGSKHVTAPNGEDQSVGELGGVQGGSCPEIPLIFGCHVEENPSCSVLLLNKSFGPVLATAAGFEGGQGLCFCL